MKKPPVGIVQQRPPGIAWHAQDLPGSLSTTLVIRPCGLCRANRTKKGPIWEQENFLDDMDNGRFFIPDLPDMSRETVITSASST